MKKDRMFLVWLGIILYNIMVVISFVTLAIILSKWWVALFGVLFICYGKVKLKYCRYCDNCGKRSPTAESYNEAIDAAEAAGWYRRPKERFDGSDNFEDFCPECRKRMKL